MNGCKVLQQQTTTRHNKEIFIKIQEMRQTTWQRGSHREREFLQPWTWELKPAEGKWRWWWGEKKEIHQRGGNEACPILKRHIRKQRYGDCGCWERERDGDELWWSCGWWREKRKRETRRKAAGITLLKSLFSPTAMTVIHSFSFCSIITLSPPPSSPPLLSPCPVKRNLALNGNRGSSDHAGLLQQGPFLSSLSPQQSSTYLPGI